MIIWILVFVALGALYYLMIIRPFKYWPERGVAYGKPVPIFGHTLGSMLKKQSFAEMVQMVYNINPGARYCGMYRFNLPTLVLKNPDLIKQITVKDFDSFSNHYQFLPEDSDPLWPRNLFSLRDQKWRDMRSTLSPAFTSSKMKYMFSLIVESAQQFTEHFLRIEKEDLITVEMKGTFTRFTNDVIANTAFGVKCDSLGKRNNEFYLMGKDATDFSGFWKNLKFIGFLFFPQLFKFCDVRFFSKAVSNFFIQLVKENITSSEKQGIVRPDMINLLLEARKNGLKHEQETLEDTGFATVEESDIGKNGTIKQNITDEDITAQALLFFFAGFDSVSSLMSFMSYELGVNQDVQERLRQEVDDTLKSCNGKLTYEALMKMKYMDMVVSEILRLWPPTPASDRVCSKPFTIAPANPGEKPIYLKKGDLVWLPIVGLHRDPQYFREPERFDPERFSDENKANIKSYTYLPFGSEPRNCIGSRFALLETKALFFHILSNFKMSQLKKHKFRYN